MVKNLPKSVMLLLFVVLTLTQKIAIASEALASDNLKICNTDEARKSAKLWDYNLLEAYEFGILIQHYVEQEDLQSLFDLVQGELSYGPRKKHIRGKLFSELFSEKWRDSVLSEKPECSPVGWRGFMLGNGKIWYNQDYETRKWQIFSINGDQNIEAAKSLLDGSWKFKGDLLTGDCFTTIWLSGDNYEHYYEKFGANKGITWKDFSENIGRYIGGPVPIAPIESPWANITSEEKISLAKKLTECRHDKALYKIAMDDGWVKKNKCFKDASTRCLVNKYRLIKHIKLDHCRRLAPYFPDNCTDIGLVQKSEETGGSLGNKVNEAIYGLINDPNTNEYYLIPLVNFMSLNDALNYVDQLNQ